MLYRGGMKSGDLLIGGDSDFKDLTMKRRKTVHNPLSILKMLSLFLLYKILTLTISSS